MEKQYICIDLKSFYASVECVERGLDPLNTNLVVADKSRTEKTICLAVSPSLKAYKISGRARLFEVVAKVKEINQLRKKKIKEFEGKSYFADELLKNPKLELDYIAAPPQMALYMRYSTDIYSVYLKYIAPEDMHIYSIDEVFIDATQYLKLYGVTARELALKMIRDVLSETGITATAGIGTNMYLAKIALDIEAKKMKPDKDGVRIAELDEMSYRQKLWSHRPLTDFWRIGKGYAKKLESNRMFTMGDIARRSTFDEDRLYKLFGINAELLIDHAWGYEPTEIKEIKTYRPENTSISQGQVLKCPYKFDKARIVIREMADNLVFDLLEKGVVTNQIVITVGYDIDNISDPNIGYLGEVTVDRYGRKVPKHAHGTINLENFTSSTKLITNATLELFDRIVNQSLLIRRMNITANHIMYEDMIEEKISFEQLDIFTNYEEMTKKREAEIEFLRKEKKLQKAMLDIKTKFGKNAIIKGTNLQDGATLIERNGQIGGHKA